MLSLISKDGRVWDMLCFFFFLNQYCKKCHAARLLRLRFKMFLTYIHLVMIELWEKLE